jgi:uncharacterized membrane protein YqiK
MDTSTIYELGIALFIAAIIVIAILYIISIWIYKRAPANMCFIRTGFLGTKVCLGKGAIVLPVFHEVTWVSLEIVKIIVGRARDQAILTADNIRIDVITELYAHVGHTEDDVLKASRSLGEKTFDADKVRNLLEAKVVSALRSYAATKTLKELHQNRDDFAREIKENVVESFSANGLTLEEVTIVTMEQTSKEFFKSDNVFDAEGLKIITEITSDARKKVHETEKRTTVAIRQKDLDTQLELLEIERNEAVARASQDKEISNEEALQLGQKQIYVLDQRMAVEEKEIENEKALERLRTDRDLSITEEAQRREVSEIQKELALEQERRDREIALIDKSRAEELAEIARTLARERAERERDIELEAKEAERQQAEIDRVTGVTTAEESARDRRHMAAEESTLAMRKRALETKLSVLEMEKRENFATARQEQEIANEKALVLSEQQRYVIERRWEVEKEEIEKDLALERARIQKDAATIEESIARETAEIQRALTREREERDRQIALVAKAEELERAEIRRDLARDSQDRDAKIVLLDKERELRETEVRNALAVELEERDREIALIAKDQERERADIQRMLAREQEERDREIAIMNKTAELDSAEVGRLGTVADKEQAIRNIGRVRDVARAERARDVERINAEREAETRRIDESARAEITAMHMVTQADARKDSATREAEATLTRAKATSEAQAIAADGIEREAGARGRADAEIEALAVANTQRRLEAEATGMEAKANALKKYNDAAQFLELSRLFIEAERDVNIDQAKAMGNALQGAQIRMYGGGDGTMDTIRGLFNSGFGIGEAMEGFAQSLPDGLRDRFNANGLRGLFGRPYSQGALGQHLEQLMALVERVLPDGDDRAVSFAEAVTRLEVEAGEDDATRQAVGVLRDFSRQDALSGLSFEQVWALMRAASRATD